MDYIPKSPREEALLIANDTRKKILNGSDDVISILRACSTIADLIKKDNDKKWITNELGGYSDKDEYPDYRNISCDYEEDGDFQEDREKFKIFIEAHTLESYLKRKKVLRLVISDEPNKIALLYINMIERMISHIIDRCLFFLNTIIQELRYSGMMSSIIDEIRNDVDGKLIGINREISDELNSIYVNLSSGTTPAEWSQVSNSCRRVLKLVADAVFPPQEEMHIGKDGKGYSVKESDYINRICAFVDNVSEGDERKLIIAETIYLGSYLDQLDALASKGVHGKITKFHASRILTHTYLLISDVIRIL